MRALGRGWSVAWICVLLGCGTDDGQSGGGSFAIEARWQQASGAQRVAACPPTPATPVPAFGVHPLPPVVHTVRVALAAPNFSCCIDLDRVTAEQRRVLITEVPQGLVDVTLSAFLQPPGGGNPIDPACVTNGVGAQCTTGPSTLTYKSA